MTEVWPGPISAAVLAAPGTELFAEQALVQAALASMREPQRLRVTLVENTGCASCPHSRTAAPHVLPSLTTRVLPIAHGSFSCPARFPFNALRNLALSRCVEELVLIVDVDFVPMPVQRAGRLLRQLAATTGPNTAIVLPAFEAVHTGWRQSNGTHMNVEKQALRELLRTGKVVPFGAQGGTREQWLPAHSCTQTARWLQARSPFQIHHCHPQYEPYVLLPRAATHRFDESFAGRGFDKISFIYELFARGVRFWSAPEAFVVHEPGPHAPEPTCNHTDTRRHATSTPLTAEQEEEERAQRLNPGETCTRGFLARMRSTYRYAPAAKGHAAFRRDVQAQGWKCNALHEVPLPAPRTLHMKPRIKFDANW